MPSHTSANVPLPPVVDEWGFYDPERAGLAALFQRLDSKGTAPEPSDAQTAASSQDAQRTSLSK